MPKRSHRSSATSLNSAASPHPSPHLDTISHTTTRHSFTASHAANNRKIYLKILVGGTTMTVFLIFGVFSIFWASLFRIPERNLPGWVVDFDQGELGTSITSALTPSSSALPPTVASLSKVTWTAVPASMFPNGPADLANAVHEQRTWVAISVNPGASARLEASIATPNASYSGQEAVTVYGVEARNENAYRSLIRPSVQAVLDGLSRATAIQLASRLSRSLPASTLATLLSTSPQTVVAPVSYTIVNLAPFNEPVATAVTFIGLLYQLILSFFIVMICNAARDASGFSQTLTTRSLILLRLGSSFAAYFVISLFYALLSVAFGLEMGRKFGHSGFLVFWMLNYAGMLACGLALESLLTLLTTSGIPFFMLTWIITNVSVCAFPIEVMPNFFRYGYAFPFYNTSIGIRTVLFGTKNRVGYSFGILIIWISISCFTLPLIQWFVRRREQHQKAADAAGPSEFAPDVDGDEGAKSRDADADTSVSVREKGSNGQTQV